MKKIVLKKRNRKKFSRVVLCPALKYRSAKCYKICRPDENGYGECGRVAPHSFLSSIQKGILDYEKSRADADIDDNF